MANDLRPCPNSKCPHRDTPGAVRLTASHYGERRFVECKCGVRGPWAKGDNGGLTRMGDAEAIELWNALPRQPQWTTYAGDEATLPPADEKVLLERHRSTGSLFCEAAKPCWHVDAYKGFAILAVGDRWMPWPEGGA